MDEPNYSALFYWKKHFNDCTFNKKSAILVREIKKLYTEYQNYIIEYNI